MKKSVQLLTTLAFVGLLMVPAVASAAESEPAAPEPAVPVTATVQTDGGFAALQINKQVYVYDANGPLYNIDGKYREGELKDLFILPYGPMEVPLILVQNDLHQGYMVFSDLWPKFAPGQEGDTTTPYYSGRVLTSNQKKITGRTSHHYAEQVGDEVITYTANDFDDLTKGYHESYRTTGKLRGLIIYDCCAYTVIDDDQEGTLSVYQAGETGAELATSIDME